MNRRIHPARIAAVVVFCAALPSLAMAYIDPGNGAYMVQVLFTLIGAGLFYVRHPIRTLQAVGRWAMARFRGESRLEAPDDTQEA